MPAGFIKHLSNQPLRQFDFQTVAVLVEDIQASVWHVAGRGLADGDLLRHQAQAINLRRFGIAEIEDLHRLFLSDAPGTPRGLLDGVDIKTRL